LSINTAGRPANIFRRSAGRGKGPAAQGFFALFFPIDIDNPQISIKIKTVVLSTLKYTVFSERMLKSRAPRGPEKAADAEKKEQFPWRS
jgi:hypothetical protein